MADLAFTEYCTDLLSQALGGTCRYRRMFGGAGISHQGLTLAITADLGEGERLYLKADAQSKPKFEREGCLQFVFEMKHKTASMNYYTAPDAALDSPDAMRPWVLLAFSAAQSADQAKVKKSIPKLKKAVLTKKQRLN